MRIAMSLGYSGGFQEAVAELGDYEKAGLQVVHVAEAYSFDAVSQLGYLAARTDHVEIASGILQLYTRSPSLIAMTAAGLDFVSDGRFTLGLGASGPQVIEGFHGIPYDSPLGRARETIEICRAVWRRETLEHHGRYYDIPLSPGKGTGLGKALKIINRPVRSRIPIVLAALGPKNVELAAEVADGWMPVFYLPDSADDIWGDALRAGQAKRDPTLRPLDIWGGANLAIGDDVLDRRDADRPHLALYIGGMGARGKNFYNDLAVRYGYPDEAKLIQDLYLSGRKEEAAAAIPAGLLERTSLIGPDSLVAERLAVFAESGVTTLTVNPIADTHAERVRYLERIRELADAL